jgi:hypothetical protein
MALPAERRAPRRQLPSLAPLLVTWLVATVGLAAVAAQRSVPVEVLFLDPAFLSGRPWYTGVVSDIGVLAWTAATVAALFGGWVAAQTGRPSAARFLRSGAVVSAILLADDLLQLHADLLRFVGLPKGVRQLIVVAPAAIWLVRYAGEIARTRWVIMVGSLGVLGGSLVVDALVAPGSRVGVFAEDGLKLLGVLAWAQYMVLTSVDITRSTIRAAQGRAEPPPRSTDAAGDPAVATSALG